MRVAGAGASAVRTPSAVVLEISKAFALNLSCQPVGGWVVLMKSSWSPLFSTDQFLNWCRPCSPVETESSVFQYRS